MSAAALSRLAALLAAAGVILGALGAHGAVHTRLLDRGTLGTWETAVFYHLIHALALWVLAGRTSGRTPVAGWCFLAGIALFSGSLYVLSLMRLPALGPITPLGGVALIAGWVWLAARPGRVGA
jgi:uncharacterized membrane protein YgdD (TMEM256/DUF423 family)